MSDEVLTSKLQAAESRSLEELSSERKSNLAAFARKIEENTQTLSLDIAYERKKREDTEEHRMRTFEKAIAELEQNTSRLITARKAQFETLIHFLREEFRKAYYAVTQARAEREALHSQKYFLIGELHMACKAEILSLIHI